jgi:hypothetical protein
MRDDSIYDMVRMLRYSALPGHALLHFNPPCCCTSGGDEMRRAAHPPSGQLEQDVHDGSGAAAARRGTDQSQ